MVEECVKVNYYARIHAPSYHCCREVHFISGLDVYFSRLDVNLTKSVEREMYVTSSRFMVRA